LTILIITKLNPTRVLGVKPNFKPKCPSINIRETSNNCLFIIIANGSHHTNDQQWNFLYQ